MRRRLPALCLALFVLTGLFLVLPVFSAPRPQPVPVKAVAAEVPMASVPAPTAAPDGRPGATPAGRPGAGPAGQGDASAAPSLTVTRTHVRTFSMVGVTWAFDPAVTATVVRVRVQNAKGAWGHWTQVGPEDAVPNQNANPGKKKKERGGTAPLWTGPSSGVQAELTTHTGARPADVKLDLIDPGTSAADSALGQPAIRDTAHAAGSMPPVFSRAQWGADESIRSWDPQYASTIKAATIHHSADSNDYTADQVPALMRAIYHYHAVSLGWGDIGYNVVVDKFGRMWEGRYGGLASTVIGAHAGGFNTYTFGVSMLGNYDIVDTPPAVISAVASIISWKFSLYGVNPLGKTTLISGGGGTDKYAPGVPVTLPTIFAHRDVGATICPGRYAYARMDQIRNLVAGTVVDLTQISKRYDSDAALRSLLGPQTAAPDLTADRSGGYATYQNGALYYSAATGVRMVQGPVRDLWTASGAEAGILRYPTTDVAATNDAKGQYARFQGGAIYSTPATGTRAVLGPIQTLWNAIGAETGVLGYPTWSVSNLPGGGQYATFEHGSIYWTTATGARVMLGPIETLWKNGGAQNGVLGYPTQSVSTAADGTGQYARFQGGSIYWSPATGAQALLGPIETAWKAGGAEQGPLGYPTSSVSNLPDGGRYATFQHGSIYWSTATGARVLSGPIEAQWKSLGAQTGALGYPTSDVTATADGVGQYATFQHGSIYAANGATETLTGGIGAAWIAAGADRGVLGAPTSGNTALPDGVGQSATFEHGSIYWSPATGARVLSGAIQALWTSQGAETGPLGYPTSDVLPAAAGGGQYATFQHGAAYWSAGTGAHVVSGPVQVKWAAVGSERGVLGFPVQDVTATADGKGQYATFEHGSIYSTPATGTWVMLGPIETLWKATGAQAGPLGYPIQSVSTTADGKGQYARFEHGSIYWTPATGARAMLGAIETLWKATGAQAGPLGYPIQSVSTTADGKGQYARFVHGSIYWTPATGARVMLGAIQQRWLTDGAERGRMGYPIQSVSWAADHVGQYARFQGGSIYWSPTTGAWEVRGPFLSAWAAVGYERGMLGYPIGEPYAVTGGQWQKFQHGYVALSTASGRSWAVHQ